MDVWGRWLMDGGNMLFNCERVETTCRKDPRDYENSLVLFSGMYANAESIRKVFNNTSK